MSDEACAFCRVGSCGIHHVLRVVPHTHPDGADDEKMVPVGCCDFLESAVAGFAVKRGRHGTLLLANKQGSWVMTFCPFCRAVLA